MRSRFHRSARIILAAAFFAALYAPALNAQKAADWPMFNRDLAGTRYSPLTQINTSNVAKLGKAWTYAFNRPG
ncbi:MAG TPA: hypothetical protein VK789_04055, partial [Bryobacteraceae bacterium]|nr:hypothetical protein [Bryobacteraceae bacterium]